MKKIDILGTRYTICVSSNLNIKEDIEESLKTGYTYSTAVAYDGGCATIIGDIKSVNTMSQGTSLYWLRREPKVHQGLPGTLLEDDYKAILLISLMYTRDIYHTSTTRRHSYYHGPIESLICFTGDTGLIDAFYDSKVGMDSLSSMINSRISGTSKRVFGSVKCVHQGYRRYCMTDFVTDLISDNAELIMDDSIYKYNWQGRTGAGYGNIVPIKESTDLYPRYKIVGIQGNQTRANLSLKFKFKAEINGTKVEVLRNLLLVQDGTLFQNMIALHVSKNLRKKLSRKGLIDVSLPGQNDIIVNIGKIDIYKRSDTRNRFGSELFKEVSLYNIYKAESDAVSKMITWTQSEIDSFKKISDANALYWSLNKDRVSSKEGKKIFTVSLKKTSSGLSAGSQEEIRAKLREIDKQKQESYTKTCMMLFNYLCSKKDLSEFLKLPKKGIIFGKTKDYTGTYKSVTGSEYTSTIHLY